MPTYEYECKSCKKRFDLLQSITAKPGAQCPKCGKAAKRLISAGAGLLFKGSGFYSTDYRSSSYKQQAKTDSIAGKPCAKEKKDKSGPCKPECGS